ncbi:MAG: polyprenyl synthetase family protein, partial [Bacteroidota bacterium]|nr:polyprenyl synthetase family protein [Bacteroidota bacterium]
DNKKIIKSINNFSLNNGIAFQIKDDFFYFSEQKIGKPVGIDIREKKITLPMIYVLNSVKIREKKWLINSIKVHNKNKKRVKEVINFVKENGGLVYAENKMNEYKNEALKSLKKFEKNKFRDALELTLNYIISRKL